MKSFDLAVIGAGPAGYTAALEASALGKSVVCIERDSIGGTCLNRGCIPTKAIIESALCLQKVKGSASYGIHSSPASVDYGKVLARAHAAIERLSKGVEFLFNKAGVEYIKGNASIAANNTIYIESLGEAMQIRAEKILVAAGARQKRNPDVFKAGERILTSTEALKLDKIPASVAVLGGGAIGLEFAWIWNAFGSDVTVVEFEKNILPSADPELSKNLERALKKQGIKIKTGFYAKTACSNGNAVSVEISDANGGTETLSGEYALWACGMEAQSDSLFCSECLPETTKHGFIRTDKAFRTSIENIYAAGDVTGAPMLAHAAMTEAKAAVRSMFDAAPFEVGSIPACVFTSPQAACVGVSDNGEDLLAAKIPYMANGKAVAAGKTEGFLKVVFEKESGIVKGAHILGEDASELISNFVIAIDKELSCSDIAKMTFPHPTLGELVLDASRSVQ